jgi:CubicO group peptidase (beta-lactamase class C family)
MKTAFAFVLLALFVPPAAAQTPALPPKTVARIDSLFKPYNRPDSPGYAVGVFRNGQVLFGKGYGMANLDYSIPNSPATVFNVASLSKQFTAACIALLILRDSISLEDEVKQYVPEVSKFEYSIRVKHLVYMTSGIPEYHAQPRKNGLNWRLYDYFTVDTAVAASLSRPKLEFEPGTRWSYSNVNYMLLTKIVEKVSGQTFGKFAEENLFAPLGMTHTHFNDDVTLVVKNRATGYVPRTKETVAGARQAGYYLREEGDYLQVHRNSPHYGGSGLFTSVEDWYRWNQNFYSRKLGGKAFYDLIHQRNKFAHDKDNDAFGLVFGNFRGEEIIWYSGGDTGFNSYIMRFPKQELTVVCFANLDVGGTAERYAHQVGNILLESKVLVPAKK